MRRQWTVLLALCLACLGGMLGGVPQCAAAKPLAPFALRDGDIVVFYGDSITEQQMYGRDIETFVLTRFPRMHVKFINSGWGGDTVRGGGGGPIDLRLTRDVVNYKPTVVTVFLGMNDAGYQPYDEARFQTYAQGLTHIVDTLTHALPGVRITLLTPSFFDYDARPRPPLPATGGGYSFANPGADYNQVLLRYGDFVKKLGRERHLTVADLNAPMAAATLAGRKADPHFALSQDGVHPNEQGHLIMAAALLTAWHATPMPSVSLEPGMAITKAYPLPWPLPASALAGLPTAPQVMPFSAWDMSIPELFIATEQPYMVRMDTQAIGTFTARQLLAGIRLAQYPALPQNVQAQSVLTLVQQRVWAWQKLWRGSAHAGDVPTEDELVQLRTADASLDGLRTQAHDAAQPHTHTFDVQTR